MAGEFNAGAVFIGFKTQTAELASGFAQAAKIVSGFGNTVEGVAKQVAVGSQTMTSSLGNVTEVVNRLGDGTSKTETAFNRQFILLKDFARGVNKAGADTQRGGEMVAQGLDTAFTRNEAKHAAKMANLVGRLLNVQFAMSNLSQKGGEDATQFDRVLQGVTKGFSTFALILSIMPNQAGLLAGAVLGLATAFGALFGQTQKEADAAAKLKAELEGVTKAVDDLFKRQQRAAQSKDLNDRFSLSPLKSEEAATNEDLLARREAQLERILLNTEKITKLNERQLQLAAELNKAEQSTVEGINLNLFGRNPDQIKLDIQAVNDAKRESINSISDAEKRLEGLTSEVLAFSTVLEAANKRDSIIKATKDQLVQIDIQLQENKTNLESGLVEPLEASNTEATLLLQKAKLLVDFQAQIKALPDQVRKGIPTFASATPEALAALDLQRRKAIVDGLASGFATSIGSAVREGILSGASAMETLANVGKNLFDNMITNAVNQLQTGLTAAFKAVAGEGGAVLGGVLTGVLGVLGGIFSKKTGVQGQSFNAAKDLVESSQAVRGVVTGPTNVAIAAVGENLKRALVGVEARLDVVIQQLNDIRRRGGTANATAPDVAIAGTVTQ